MNAMQKWRTEVRVKVYSDTSVMLSQGGNKVHVTLDTRFDCVELRFTPAGNSSIDIRLTTEALPMLRALANGMNPALLADWIEENPGHRIGGTGDIYILPLLRSAWSHCAS